MTYKNVYSKSTGCTQPVVVHKALVLLKLCKNTVDPLLSPPWGLIYFKNAKRGGGGSLIEMGAAYFLNLAKLTS